MIVTLNGSRRSLCVLLSWHNPLPQSLSILGMGERSLFCTRHPLSGRIMPPEPAASLWLPYRQVVCCLLSKKLLVWSSCFPSLFPCTPMASIKDESWTKESTLLGMNMCFVDVALARQSACLFSSLEIWTNLAWRSPTYFLICFRYFFILSRLHS